MCTAFAGSRVSRSISASLARWRSPPRRSTLAATPKSHGRAFSPRGTLSSLRHAIRYVSESTSAASSALAARRNAYASRSFRVADELLEHSSLVCFA
jgi:hypothetical protein